MGRSGSAGEDTEKTKVAGADASLQGAGGGVGQIAWARSLEGTERPER